MFNWRIISLAEINSFLFMLTVAEFFYGLANVVNRGTRRMECLGANLEVYNESLKTNSFIDAL